MEPIERNKTIDKVKKILQTIHIMIEKLWFSEDEKGMILIQVMEDIIKEQKLFENVDMKRISSLEKNYITFNEFKTANSYYDILYEKFLNKIYKIIQNKEKNIARIALFQTFNQAYFYRKFLKYMSQFLEKHQEKINDDIIKEKLFEIVHSLQSSEKMFLEDFYFYISILTIHHYYPINDISFPEFEKINDSYFNNRKMTSFLNHLKDDKLSIIYNINYDLKFINSKNILTEFLSTIENEIEENNIFKNVVYGNFDWNQIITKTEKQLFIYLKENKSDMDLIKLYEHLNNNTDEKKIFQFYFLDEMKSFLSLSEEDKYLIVNSFNIKEKLSLQIMNYIKLKNSYDEGMKKENILKETIQNIIEDENFFNDLRDIFTSEKVVDYCKNPFQYKKSGEESADIYDEKKIEKEKNRNRFKKDKIITKFTIPKEQNEQKEKEIDFETHGFPDLFTDTFDEELNNIKEEEYKCQLYLDYEYFINNVFDKNFLKERIIYSFLPYGIKAHVTLIPKIVINMCGNNIESYNIETNDSENYKKILKGLYIVIIIHELIHFIRRENPDRPLSNEYTPMADKGPFEGGKSFIYHIFGGFIVMYMDLEFAKVILNKDSWKKDCKDLKEQFLRFKNKKDDEIMSSFKEKELIKCYDSTIEIKDESDEDYDFCFRSTA